MTARISPDHCPVSGPVPDLGHRNQALLGQSCQAPTQVLGLLQNFSGTEPMKSLFWSQLNYTRANKPITRRGWADGTAALLHEDPVLLATGGTDDDFRVVYSRLAENRLPLGGERLVVSRLLKDCPYSLFLFSDKSQTHWHFLNVKLAEDRASASCSAVSRLGLTSRCERHPRSSRNWTWNPSALIYSGFRRSSSSSGTIRLLMSSLSPKNSFRSITPFLEGGRADPRHP